ncbi:hypothetical protein CLOP_g14249 [Closterium sp. NIES-67]|nr:hypothetical protein CLOP_g14249 [Closterium sp. NIES-67]
MSRPVQEKSQEDSVEDLSLSVPVSQCTDHTSGAATWLNSISDDDSPLAGVAVSCCRSFQPIAVAAAAAADVSASPAGAASTCKKIQYLGLEKTASACSSRRSSSSGGGNSIGSSNSSSSSSGSRSGGSSSSGSSSRGIGGSGSSISSSSNFGRRLTVLTNGTSGFVARLLTPRILATPQKSQHFNHHQHQQQQQQQQQQQLPPTIILLLPDGGVRILTEPVTAGSILQGFPPGAALGSVTSRSSTLSPGAVLRLGSTYRVWFPSRPATVCRTCSCQGSADPITAAGFGDAVGKSMSLPREAREATEEIYCGEVGQLWRARQEGRHMLLLPQVQCGADTDEEGVSDAGVGAGVCAQQQEAGLPWGVSREGCSSNRSMIADCWAAEGDEAGEETMEDGASEETAWGFSSSFSRSFSRSSSSGADRASSLGRLSFEGVSEASPTAAGESSQPSAIPPGATVISDQTSCALIGQVSSAAEAADMAAEAAARLRAMALQAARELVEIHRFPRSFPALSTVLSRPPTAPCALLGPGNSPGIRPGFPPGYSPGYFPGNREKPLQGTTSHEEEVVALAVSQPILQSQDGHFPRQGSTREMGQGTGRVSDRSMCTIGGNGTPYQFGPGPGRLNSRLVQVEENEAWDNRCGGDTPGPEQDFDNSNVEYQSMQALLDSGTTSGALNAANVGGVSTEAVCNAGAGRPACVRPLLSPLNPPESPCGPLSPSCFSPAVDEPSPCVAPTPRRLSSRFGITVHRDAF